MVFSWNAAVLMVLPIMLSFWKFQLTAVVIQVAFALLSITMVAAKESLLNSCLAAPIKLNTLVLVWLLLRWVFSFSNSFFFQFFNCYLIFYYFFSLLALSLPVVWPIMCATISDEMLIKIFIQILKNKSNKQTQS